MTPIKAIRAFCLDCCGGSPSEVKQCVSQNCPLFAFRLGHNPNIQPREMTDEQREAAAARLANARARRNG